MVKKRELELPQLLEKIKVGDKEAFKEFFFIMQPHIMAFLYRFTSDKEAANDLCQETFIKFWLSRDKINLSSFPKAYLYQIAKNLALNFITRKPPVVSYEDDETLLTSLSKNPENDYDNFAMMDDLQKALNRLPERCRLTFILSRFDGFEYSEIAEIMNVSLQTVKNQMNKAISDLRKQLS